MMPLLIGSFCHSSTNCSSSPSFSRVQDGRNADAQSALSRVANHALDALVGLRPTQTIVARFDAVNRHFEVHVRPIRNANRAVRDDHVATKVAANPSR